MSDLMREGRALNVPADGAYGFEATASTWTYEDVARHFRKAVRTVRRWPLPRLAVPGHPRFDPDAVKAWAANRDANRLRFRLERGA